MNALLEVTDAGLYCPPGNFHIDPWRPVPRAIISHAHSDHVRPGCGSYLTTVGGKSLMRIRLGDDAAINCADYGERETCNGVRISLHPAGHIFGSAQVRLEYRGQVAVVSGDYKRQADPTCASFEPLACDLFVSESTYGLPVFRWRSIGSVLDEVHSWWRRNQALDRTSVLYAYSPGKAQRMLAELDGSIGPILAHGSVMRYLDAYRAAGVRFPEVRHATSEAARAYRGRALVLAPPWAGLAAWLRKFGDVSTAIASGWMQIRGMRRRRAVDCGFVLSDHADWGALAATVRETGAREVWVTHGYAAIFARWLGEQGVNARPIATPYAGETIDPSTAAEPPEEPAMAAHGAGRRRAGS